MAAEAEEAKKREEYETAIKSLNLYKTQLNQAEDDQTREIWKKKIAEISITLSKFDRFIKEREAQLAAEEEARKQAEAEERRRIKEEEKKAAELKKQQEARKGTLEETVNGLRDQLIGFEK